MNKKILIAGFFVSVMLMVPINSAYSNIEIQIDKKSINPSYRGNTLYVGGNGSGNYTTIQSAIDDAFDGDTVFVYEESSPYYEDVEVYKSINLVGEDKNTTEIFEWDEPYAITITADYVNISGFTINCYYYWGSILVESCNNNISENIIKGDWYGTIGIEISDNRNNTIINNDISNNQVGLYIHTSSNNTIMGNIFSSNSYFGMIAYQSSENVINNNKFQKNQHDLSIDKSYNNTILMNNFLDNKCCVCISIYNSYNNIISLNNIVQDGWGACIELINNSLDNIITDNINSNGSIGIDIWQSCNNNTIKNNLIFNNEIGIQLSSNNNLLYHNDLIKNNENAIAIHNNTWDNDYPSGGNYWSDYTGEDIDGDGIGDTHYPIPGGDNQDRYPLMKPYSEHIAPFAAFKWTPEIPVPGEKIHFNASDSIDYDGFISLYEWDWDNDGVFDENHTDPYTIHIWENIGDYPVTLRITDNDSLTNIKTKYVLVWMIPLEPPSIIGPKIGKVGVEYDFEFVQMNPEDHKISYFIDWGDNTTTGWTDYYNSGEVIVRSHAWYENGVFRIKAKVKSIYGMESDWDVFLVRMPRYRAKTNSFFLRFLECFPLLERLLTVWRWNIR